MADIKLTIEEQRVLNDVFKRLTENMGYTENALTTPLGTLLGVLTDPMPLPLAVSIAVKTCAFLEGEQIGNRLYDARFNAGNGSQGLLFGVLPDTPTLELINDQNIPGGVQVWGEILPDDGLGNRTVRIRFKAGFNFPSVSQINDAIGQLPNDRFDPTHLTGGVNGTVPQYALWSLLFFFRAGTIGTAGNSFIVTIAGGGPDAGSFSFDGIHTLTFNHSVNTNFEDLFNAVIGLAGPSAAIFAATGDDATYQQWWMDNIGFGTPATTTLDSFGVDGDWVFSGGVDGTAGTRASLDCFPVGNHHLDTVFEDHAVPINIQASGNALTIQLGSWTGPGVRVTQTINNLLIEFQSGVSTVLDVENAVNAFGFIGDPHTIRVKSPGTATRVLWNDSRHAFMFLDSDFPGTNPGGTLLTSSTVGVAYLQLGADDPAPSVVRRQWMQANVSILNYGNNPQGRLAFDDETPYVVAFFGPTQVSIHHAPDSPNANGLLRVEATVQDDVANTGAVRLLNITLDNNILSNGPPKLFYTAKFDGLASSGEVTLVVQGANRDPFYLTTFPQAGDYLVFLAEVGNGTGFVGVKNGRNGAGFISLDEPNITFHGGGKPPAGGDQLILVVQLDPVTGQWLKTYDIPGQFGNLIQFGGPPTNIYQSDAGLDTSAVSLGVLYQAFSGISSVIYDGNGQFQTGLFAAAIGVDATLLQRANGLVGKSYIAVFARPS